MKQTKKDVKLITTETKIGCAEKEWNDTGIIKTQRKRPNSSLNLLNQRFGNLVALERKSGRNGYLWLCRCDCGVLKWVEAYSLNSGIYKSCGCLRKPNLMGLKFGYWEIIEKTVGKNGRKAWKCKCICGKIGIHSTNKLKSGATKSCGCKREPIKENISARKPKTSLFNCIIHSYRRNAKIRGLEYSLSENEAKELFIGKCYYCGDGKRNEIKNSYESLEYNGIDRINNSIGYIKDNCVSCCKNCNFTKNNKTLKDFILWVRAVYNNTKYLNIGLDLQSQEI